MIDNDTVQEIGWVKSIDGWQYRDENGLVKNDWKQVEDKWYRFDSTGYTICNDWFKIQQMTNGIGCIQMERWQKVGN